MTSSLVLHPLSALYGAIVRTRLAAYSHGLMSASHLSAPVISVGNITVGGTGKTPLVEWICRAVATEGRKVCVLTRGYRREKPAMRVLVSDGVSITANERQAGDEAFLLAENLRGVAAVISDADRLKAGRWAIEYLRADAFVLDDGFQHFQLARDLDIVVIDATDPWGGKRLLPYGRLREPLSSLKRADCVLITRAESKEAASTLIDEVHKLTANKPVFTSRMTVTGLHSISGEPTNRASLEEPLGAFCGIGNPDSFFDQVRQSARSLAFTQPFADHHRYTQKDIDELLSRAGKEGAAALITTAKDAVKLRSFSFGLPCYVMVIEIKIDEEKQFNALIKTTLNRD